MTNAVETEPRAPESTAQPTTGKSAADPPSETPSALFRIREFYPELKNKVTDWTCSVVDRMCETLDHKGVDCLADTVAFAEQWKPSNHRPDIASIIAMLQKCSPEFRRGLAAELAYQIKQDEDAKEWRTTNFALGERMKAEHLFRGWATIIRNMIPMLEAITCFTDEDGRQTKFDDQDGVAINTMVGFAVKELEELARDCDRAGDYSNPRFITPSGHVWKLNISAVLIEKTDEPEGGAS